MQTIQTVKAGDKMGTVSSGHLTLSDFHGSFVAYLSQDCSNEAIFLCKVNDTSFDNIL